MKNHKKNKKVVPEEVVERIKSLFKKTDGESDRDYENKIEFMTKIMINVSCVENGCELTDFINQT